jgi:hypothetical protein
MTLATIARQLEIAGRSGDTETLGAGVQQLTAIFTQVKTVLEALRDAPAEYLGKER